jgi:hypothetical protein
MARCSVCGDIQVERMSPLVLCGGCDAVDNRLLLLLYGLPLLLIGPPLVVLAVSMIIMAVSWWPQTYPYVPMPPAPLR